MPTNTHCRDFNPRFPRGKRRYSRYQPRRDSRYFNPRFPRGKRLPCNCSMASLPVFQSTLPAREATSRQVDNVRLPYISIHASREGSDKIRIFLIIGIVYFNPRFPRGKRLIGYRDNHAITDFNPRFPRGKRHSSVEQQYLKDKFQSTLPAREATRGRPWILSGSTNFNPRFPRGKRPRRDGGQKPRKISIHASREGSDPSDDIQLSLFKDFNPRFPRGKRLLYVNPGYIELIFQSTLPAREATYIRDNNIANLSNFNPRFPRGKRQYQCYLMFLLRQFQSTLPAREATLALSE